MKAGHAAMELLDYLTTAEVSIAPAQLEITVRDVAGRAVERSFLSGASIGAELARHTVE